VPRAVRASSGITRGRSEQRGRGDSATRGDVRGPIVAVGSLYSRTEGPSPSGVCHRFQTLLYTTESGRPATDPSRSHPGPSHQPPVSHSDAARPASRPTETHCHRPRFQPLASSLPRCEREARRMQHFIRAVHQEKAISQVNDTCLSAYIMVAAVPEAGSEIRTASLDRVTEEQRIAYESVTGAEAIPRAEATVTAGRSGRRYPGPRRGSGRGTLRPRRGRRESGRRPRGS